MNGVMKLVRPQPTFTIDDVPVYGVLKCSASSPNTLNSLQSFDYCKERGLFLQSAGTAVVVRKAFFDDAGGNLKVDLDSSNEYQKLGTLALAYRDGSEIVRVFSEIDMSAESRDLLVKGVEARSKNSELFLPLTDSLVQRLISSGRRTDPLENNPLGCSVEGSQYSMASFNIALFGSQEIAEVNASYLRARGKPRGFSYDYTRAVFV